MRVRVGSEYPMRGILAAVIMAAVGGRAPFADGYVEVQLGWLWRHVVAGTG